MPVSRRTFLKLGGSLLLARTTGNLPEWVHGVRLGRMTESRIRLYNRPRP